MANKTPRTVRKKVQAVIETVEPKTTWQKIKDWFYNSESIALTWIMGAFGTITGIVGTLDLSPFWTLFQTGTEFTSKQLAWMGAGVLGSAVALYIARVRGTKVVEGTLVPKAS
jgi:hypothetical protein